REPIMADNDRIAYDATYRFFIEIDSMSSPLRVKDVSGLKMTTKVTRVREGGNNEYEVAMIEGQTYEPLSLKKGFLAPDDCLYMWMNELHGASPTSRTTVRIILLQDGEGGGTEDEIGTYELYGAFISEYEGPSFDSTGKDIAFESIKIQYDYFEYYPA
ncbi:MAG: phage tail protein, partial [Myxococcota bacterium]|nr:phage tail protein [Myxococcota bacterium]